MKFELHISIQKAGSWNNLFNSCTFCNVLSVLTQSSERRNESRWRKIFLF